MSALLDFGNRLFCVSLYQRTSINELGHKHVRAIARIAVFKSV